MKKSRLSEVPIVSSLKRVEMAAKTGALTRTAPARTFTWMQSR